VSSCSDYLFPKACQLIDYNMLRLEGSSNFDGGDRLAIF
jgi:hypothetical protein